MWCCGNSELDGLVPGVVTVRTPAKRSPVEVLLKAINQKLALCSVVSESRAVVSESRVGLQTGKEPFEVSSE